LAANGVPGDDIRQSLYELALFLKPDQADAQNNLGAALITQGRFDQAVEHAEDCAGLSCPPAGFGGWENPDCR